jgi:DNA-binding NtrC family response regulator
MVKVESGPVKGECKMSLIFWIDKNTLAASLVEKTFLQEGLKLYTLANVENFSYLVEDLNPSLIILDFETYLLACEQFKSQYLQSSKMQSTPFIILGEGQINFIQKMYPSIQKPFNPFILPGKIKQLVVSH